MEERVHFKCYTLCLPFRSKLQPENSINHCSNLSTYISSYWSPVNPLKTPVYWRNSIVSQKKFPLFIRFQFMNCSFNIFKFFLFVLLLTFYIVSHVNTRRVRGFYSKAAFVIHLHKILHDLAVRKCATIFGFMVVLVNIIWCKF